MSIKTIIVDDDINSQKAIQSALKKYDEIQIVKTFEKSHELFDYLENNSVDLFILDIELDEESGFDIAKKIRNQSSNALIIFFTGHASYAIDGYDFQPVSFLTKPINYEKLDKAIQNVYDRIHHQENKKNKQIMIRCLKEFKIISVDDIYYVERRNRKNYIVTKQGELRIANYTVKEIEEMLEPYDFFSCHQSFVVSLSKIKNIKEISRQLYELSIENCKEKIPMSRNKYEELKQRFDYPVL